MSYKVELESGKHDLILKETLQVWGKQEHDVYLVGTDGLSVFSQKMMLSFYSKVLRDVLQDALPKPAAISLPATGSTIMSLVTLMVKGMVSVTKKSIEEIKELGSALGIDLGSCTSFHSSKGSTSTTKGKLKIVKRTLPPDPDQEEVKESQWTPVKLKVPGPEVKSTPAKLKIPEELSILKRKSGLKIQVKEAPQSTTTSPVTKSEPIPILKKKEKKFFNCTEPGCEDKTFKSMNSLKAHQEIRHKPKVTKKDRVDSDKVQQEISSQKTNLLKGRKQIKETVVDDPDDPDQVQEGDVSEDVILELDNSLSENVVVEQIAEDPLLNDCGYCGKKYADDDELNDHIIANHT